ncbi:MAG: hypothetical protein ACTSU2_03105 [Promethearchaeota archaeon]
MVRNLRKIIILLDVAKDIFSLDLVFKVILYSSIILGFVGLFYLIVVPIAIAEDKKKKYYKKGFGIIFSALLLFLLYYYFSIGGIDIFGDGSDQEQPPISF